MHQLSLLWLQIEAQQAELEVQFDVAKRLGRLMSSLYKCEKYIYVLITGIEGLDRFQQNEKVLSTDDIEELKELIKQGRVKVVQYNLIQLK